MDFDLSDEQRGRQVAAADFAEAVLSPGARERDAAGSFDRALWQRAADFGLAGLVLPAEHGGNGLGPLDAALVLEAAGCGSDDRGLLFSLCAHQFACAVPLWRAGNEVQRRRYLEPLATGQLIGAGAATEPGAGSDVFALRTHATREGEQYLLEGSKCFVSNAPVADLFVLYATTDPDSGLKGITAFVVPRDTPGLTVGTNHPKTGLRTAPWAELYLDGCRLPASARLGAEGAGASIFARSMAYERGCLFAVYVGAMQRVLDRAVAHARERQQFGHPIGHFQAVSHRLADMKARLETSRLLLYRATWLLGQGRRCEAELALSKLWISESAVELGLAAVQIFGGSGAATDSGVDALLRDALPARIFSGTSEMQKQIIAGHLGLR